MMWLKSSKLISMSPSLSNSSTMAFSSSSLSSSPSSLAMRRRFCAPEGGRVRPSKPPRGALRDATHLDRDLACPVPIEQTERLRDLVLWVPSSVVSGHCGGRRRAGGVRTDGAGESGRWGALMRMNWSLSSWPVPSGSNSFMISTTSAFLAVKPSARMAVLSCGEAGSNGRAAERAGGAPRSIQCAPFGQHRRDQRLLRSPFRRPGSARSACGVVGSFEYLSPVKCIFEDGSPCPGE